MKFQLPLALVLTLALHSGAFAQDAASDVRKAAKGTGHGTANVTEDTAHGTSKAVQDTAHSADHAVKKTGHGVKKGAHAIGHGVKKGTTKTADVLK
jgi:hypothetical protein